MIVRVTDLTFKKHDEYRGELQYKLNDQNRSIAYGSDEPIVEAIWEKIKEVYKPGVLSETQLMNRLKKFSAELSSDHTVQMLNKKELIIK